MQVVDNGIFFDCVEEIPASNNNNQYHSPLQINLKKELSYQKYLIQNRKSDLIDNKSGGDGIQKASTEPMFSSAFMSAAATRPLQQ